MTSSLREPAFIFPGQLAMEGNAVSTLENVEFLAAINVTARVTREREFVIVEVRSRRLTIVAGEKDQRVLQPMVGCNRFGDLTHHMVYKQNKVAVSGRIAATDKLRCRNDGSVWSR